MGLYDLAIYTLTVSLAVVLGFYGSTANWRIYAAGRRLFTLLGLMLALMLYSSVLRAFEIRERNELSAVFVFALAAGVLWMGATMRNDWRRGRDQDLTSDHDKTERKAVK